MYKGQYLIFKEKGDCAIDGFFYHLFGDFTIYAHADLNITIKQRRDRAIVLIGFIIDPFRPEKSNEQIVDDLFSACSNPDDFFQAVHPLSGRFVTLVRIKDQYFVSGDACHYRQIFHSCDENHFAITSSPKLFLDFFNLDPVIGEEKQMLISHPLFLNRENSWYGNGSEDDRLIKLLPNHFFHISENVVKRMPVPNLHNAISEAQTIEYVAEVLTGTYKALVKRYKLIQALTAGWDTRLLLAATKDFKDQIEYFVFDRQDKKGPKSADARTAYNLSERLGLNFKTISPKPLTEEFLQRYKKEHVIPRILPKTANIQYYDEQR
jgi:hypothetical protein